MHTGFPVPVSGSVATPAKRRSMIEGHLTAIAGLQQQLVAKGRTAAEVSLVVPVMNEIRRQGTPVEERSILSKLFTRWGLGFGAVGATAALILFFGLTAPNAHAKAARIMAKGAQAIGKLKTIHFLAQMRTLPADNFSQAGAGLEPVAVEFWKQFEPELKWRVEKPGRVAVMDGRTTLLYIKPPGNVATQSPFPASSIARSGALWMRASTMYLARAFGKR